MAAPTPTARVTPTGSMLENGYQSLITFASDTDIDLWEKTIQPPGLEGGDPVDITTMHNTVLHTKAPQALSDTGESSVLVAYDPAVLDQIIAIINTVTTVTITLPDGSSWAFYGYLRSFQPSALANGTHPEANIVIVPTNVDPANDTEEEVVYTAPTP